MRTKSRNSRSDRRGITLLMVVSIIVLFLLMGTAFVVLSTQFRRSTTSYSHVRERRDDARSLVSRAFYDLLREPNLENTKHPLRGQSILGDMYGYGARNEGLSRAALTISPTGWTVVASGFTNDLDDQAFGLSPHDNIYNGRIMTITAIYESSVAKPFKPISGIVVGYSGGTNTFTVAYGWNDTVDLTTATFDTFDIHLNSRPFNGSGAGDYNASASLQTAALSLSALAPNRKGEARNDLYTQYLSRNGMANSLSTNEDYDAIDFQNMFLAGIRTGDVLGQNRIISITPSFYRPELTKNAGGTTLLIPSLGDPSRQDNFLADILLSTGARYQDMLDSNGNPVPDGIPDLYVAGSPTANNYDTNGDGVPDIEAWDVDNDGDGIKDSIWMDLNYPIQTDMRGRVYKALVSYHVQDMDGRLNVNAHGNEFHIDPQLVEFGLYMDSGAVVSRGQGYGPPEISLLSALSPAEVQQLFRGIPGNVAGRYGFDSGGAFPVAGRYDTLDYKTSLQFAGYPNAAFDPPTFGLTNTNFRSWMDMHGRFEVGVANFQLTIDQTPFDSTNTATVNIPIGMPIANITDSSISQTTELNDSAYEMDFAASPFGPSIATGIDAGFSPTEWEAVLRVYDADASALPQRLKALVSDFDPSSGGFDSTSRFIFTTDSYDVPTPPRYLVHVMSELINTSVPTNLFTPEVFLGKKMNVNFGTTPAERQQYATSLYLIALLATETGQLTYDYNENGVLPFEDLNGNLIDDDTEAYRKDVAQWAANAVDFRDADAVNTGFVFDLNPFEPDGTPWDFSGNTVVRIWGAERPELLLTESLTMHDRRTENLPNDDNDNIGGNLYTGSPPPDDDDFDSRYVPNASTFVEIYNPHFHSPFATTSNNTEFRPTELCLASGAVHLNRTAPDGAPVWRLRVLKSSTNSNTETPDDAAIADADLVRMIYMIKPTAELIAEVSTPQKIYFPDQATISNSGRQIGLLPGERAVVGSAGTQVGNEYRTYIGRRLDLDFTQTRKIALNAVANTLTSPYFDSTSPPLRPYLARGPMIPIGRQYDPTDPTGPGKQRSLGLTDPVLGYDVNLSNPNYSIRALIAPTNDGFEFYDVSTNLQVIMDTPADKQLQPIEWDNLPNELSATGGLNDDGLLGSALTYHLQRLADPNADYDATVNPYLTVDYIGTDVLCFNGITADPEPGADGGAGVVDAYVSFDRADFEDQQNYNRLLWKGTQDASTQSAPPPASTPWAADGHYVHYNIEHSLGQIDLMYRTAVTDAFAWLNWNNRPFVSHLELINVPYTPQGLLPSRFHSKRPDNPYEGIQNIVGPEPKEAFPNMADQFNHLFGFHHDSYATASPNGAPGLHRILDYVEVPSRFAGTQGTLRYPGKINLNTLADARVWNGLMQAYSGELTYANFDANRRGAAGFPTEIGYPYRSAEAANYVPMQTMVARTANPTLFRSTDPAAPQDPLFEPTSATVPYADYDRNAYFNYDMRQRLGNLVTNRSSVFAVWVTIGFFEVDPVTMKPTTEVGLEDGTRKRYRGFYIVDRSIPVAFEPGVNHNVDNCILSSSIIQQEIHADDRK